MEGVNFMSAVKFCLAVNFCFYEYFESEKKECKIVKLKFIANAHKIAKSKKRLLYCEMCIFIFCKITTQTWTILKSCLFLKIV